MLFALRRRMRRRMLWRFHPEDSLPEWQVPRTQPEEDTIPSTVIDEATAGTDAADDEDDDREGPPSLPRTGTGPPLKVL